MKPLSLLTYKDIENLPREHPLYIAFNKQVALELQQPPATDLKDEESKAYFDRYIAGDR